MNSILRFVIVLAILCFATSPNATLAFLPPFDTVGPLTVSIQAPSLVSQVEVPVRIGVLLENRGDRALQGTVRLQVIDRWRVEPASQPFTVEKQSKMQLMFTAIAGKGTFNALYSVHVFAEFEWQGKRQVAHPILVVQTAFPSPPRAQETMEWKPMTVRPNGAVALWRLPARRAGSRVVQQRPAPNSGGVPDPVAIPWLNLHPKERPGEVVHFAARADRGGWREGLAMELLSPRYLHGWEAPGSGQPMGGLSQNPSLTIEGRLEMAQAEFPLALPKGQPIRLRFANAVGDGAGNMTFRVRVLDFDAPGEEGGKIVFEQRIDSKVWRDAEADLSAFAGRNIRLQLESGGAQESSKGIQAYWAEPTLIAGQPSMPGAFPPPAGAKPRELGAVEGDQGRYEARVWPGQRGLLDATVGLADGQRRLLFHGFRVNVLGDQLEDWRSVSELAEVREEAAGAGRYRVRHRFSNWAGSFDLLGEMWTERGALWARFWMENAPAPRPWLYVRLEDVAAGPWSEQARRVYFGHGHVLQNPGAFRLDYGGHEVSTSFIGFDFSNDVSLVQGLDVPPTDLEVDAGARLYTLHTANPQTIAFIPTRDVWNGVKVWRDVNGLKAAGGVAKKAGRFVFDIWGRGGGGYSQGAKSLARAFRYGLTDSLVVWHTWQHWGYDFRLPEIYPPDPDLGTLDEFRELVNVCTKQGVPFAPHDNYVDFYPDTEGFSYEQNIAFTEDRQPKWGWYHGGHGGAQSYHPRAERLRPFVERNMRLMKEGFAHTGIFIDVWTSICPYEYWTSDGQFLDRVSTRKTWGETFAWIRDFLGDNAPTISEAGHDQLIGWLDGSDAQHLRVEPGKAYGRPGLAPITLPCTETERIPWFDAAHHDRFIHHGAGYPSRYTSGLDSRSHGNYSDDYITTEVLDGVPAMVSDAFGRETVRTYWLLHDMMRAFALRRIDSVEFSGGNLHRQQVRWNNGGEVLVNRDAAEWNVPGHTLPQYGYYVRIPEKGGNVESAIEKKDGIIVEWSRSPLLLYVNARPVVFDPVPERPRMYARRGMEDAGPDPRPSRMNPDRKPISFGAVTTDGACRITLEGGALQVTPLPLSPAFTVRLRWKELPWQLGEAKEAEALDENGNVLRRAALAKEGVETILNCEADVYAYRLR